MKESEPCRRVITRIILRMQDQLSVTHYNVYISLDNPISQREIQVDLTDDENDISRCTGTGYGTNYILAPNETSKNIASLIIKRLCSKISLDLQHFLDNQGTNMYQQDKQWLLFFMANTDREHDRAGNTNGIFVTAAHL
jgi:hypothetical protein